MAEGNGRMRGRPGLACILAGATFIAAPGAGAYSYREIRDWAVSCSNGLSCTITYSKPDNPGLNHLNLARSAAPNASVVLALPFPPGYGDKGDAKGRFILSVDGRAVLDVPVAELDADANAGKLALTAQQPVADLVAAMKDGRELQLRYQGDLGSFTLPVPLSGVTASLRYVDEVQGRVGRLDALEAKGEGAVPSASPARDLDTYAELPAEIRGDFDNEAGFCSISPSGLANADGFEAILPEGRRIVVLPCQAGGAYNQAYALYASFGDGLVRMDFPVIGERGPGAMNLAYNIDYDPVNGTLASFFRGRGIGDCGSYYIWWITDGSDDNPLVLKEQREKGECDGDNRGGVQNWPLTWPAP